MFIKCPRLLTVNGTLSGTWEVVSKYLLSEWRCQDLASLQGRNIVCMVKTEWGPREDRVDLVSAGAAAPGNAGRTCFRAGLRRAGRRVAEASTERDSSARSPGPRAQVGPRLPPWQRPDFSFVRFFACPVLRCVTPLACERPRGSLRLRRAPTPGPCTRLATWLGGFARSRHAPSPLLGFIRSSPKCKGPPGQGALSPAPPSPPQAPE